MLYDDDDDDDDDDDGVCVAGCYSDRTQQLRQLYKTLQAARKLQTSASATATS